jgi:hypothetical protein
MVEMVSVAAVLRGLINSCDLNDTILINLANGMIS